MPISTVECCDCMDFMAKFPDKFFSLAIVDPPYGIGFDGQKENKATNRFHHEFKGWDATIPSRQYFDELFRVSDNQIIWGGNYMVEHLRASRCWLVWDKIQIFSGADFEMAWTSFDSSAKAFRMSRVEAYANQDKIHPTQKPVKLYKWLLTNYAKPGDKILDTHMGSQSSRIAAYQMGFDFWGCEIDPEYFEQGCKRFEKEASQQALFTPETTTEEQNKLFKEATP